ncbi:MAG: hypothetical protein EON95_09385 [Caulobacteraceae bacterium]|nr:MAG: hypothetical protein EON95_09385 [Caulobacteraceae bacterium]
MRGLWIAGAVTAVLIGVTGFGTVRSSALGQDAEHERITRQGMLTGGPFLGPWTLSELAGENGTWGAVGAPDNPARGLMSSMENHCDSADFFDEKGYPQSKADAQKKLEACRNYIFARLNEAVRDAGALAEQTASGKWVPRADQMPSKANDCSYLGTKGRAKCNVLEDIGLALHASQDFYSHSNWGDRENTGKPIARDNPRGLNNSVPAAWLDPASPGTPFPDGLITGCYEGFPEPTNCNYGFFKSRVKHSYLNKDGAGKDRASINGNFQKVFNLAATDTWRKWQWVESQIMATYPGSRGNAIICGLRNDSAASCQ